MPLSLIRSSLTSCSARHRLIKKLVGFSLLVTGGFGVGSILYVYAQGSYQQSLEINRAFSAYKISIQIDKQNLLKNLVNNSRDCEFSKIQTCRPFVESISMTKNRIEDYQILMTKSLGLNESQELPKRMLDARLLIDNLTQGIFNLSLAQAKEEGVSSIDQFLSIIQSNNSDLADNKADQKKEKLVDYISSEFNFYSEIEPKEIIDDLDPQYGYRNLVIAFSVLVSLEIILFLLVNIADLINNNADPENGYEFSLRTIQPKITPLAISLAFTFVAMVMGQSLLYREGAASLVDHCRELNRQNISFYGALVLSKDPSSSILIHPLLQPPLYCYELIKTISDPEVEKLNVYFSQDDTTVEQAFGMKLRLFADAYNDLDSTLSANTKHILLLLLIFNVSAMFAMSVFLRYDSEDLG